MFPRRDTLRSCTVDLCHALQQGHREEVYRRFVLHCQKGSTFGCGSHCGRIPLSGTTTHSASTCKCTNAEGFAVLHGSRAQRQTCEGHCRHYCTGLCRFTHLGASPQPSCLSLTVRLSLESAQVRLCPRRSKLLAHKCLTMGLGYISARASLYSNPRLLWPLIASVKRVSVLLRWAAAEEVCQGSCTSPGGHSGVRMGGRWLASYGQLPNTHARARARTHRHRTCAHTHTNTHDMRTHMHMPTHAAVVGGGSGRGKDRAARRHCRSGCVWPQFSARPTAVWA